MRAHRLACLLAVSALLGTGCGLPDPYYLSPPVVTVASTLDYKFQLQTTDRTAEPEFRGYELYYKIYASDSAAQAEQNVGGTDPGVSALTAKGFMAATRGLAYQPPSGGLAADASADTRTAPLLPIAPSDRSSSFTIIINFNPALGVTYEPTTNFSYTSPTTGAILQAIDRHVNSTPSGCKPFTFGQGYYVQQDQDVSAVWSSLGSAPGSTIYVAMYAVSYGLLDVSTPIYSYPVYMGYLQLSSYIP